MQGPNKGYFATKDTKDMQGKLMYIATLPNLNHHENKICIYKSFDQRKQNPQRLYVAASRYSIIRLQVILHLIPPKAQFLQLLPVAQPSLEVVSLV